MVVRFQLCHVTELSMKGAIKISFSLFISLGIVAALLASAAESPFYQSFIYGWFIITCYGWILYSPFAYIISIVANISKFKYMPLLFTVAVLLAAFISACLLASPFAVTFSKHKIIDVICFAVGGGIYSVLYKEWVMRYQVAEGK